VKLGILWNPSGGRRQQLQGGEGSVLRKVSTKLGLGQIRSVFPFGPALRPNSLGQPLNKSTERKVGLTKYIYIYIYIYRYIYIYIYIYSHIIYKIILIIFKNTSFDFILRFHCAKHI